MTEIIFRKASQSASNGACVEVAADFRRSTRCEAQNCVEVAIRPTGQVLVRDSKDPHSPILGFSRRSWMRLVDAVQSGELA